MKWYEKIFSRIFNGILIFLMPLIFLLFILERALVLIEKVIAPIKNHLPDLHFFGLGVVTFASLLFILLLCYIAGILIEKRRVKRLISSIENLLTLIIPSYSLLKTRANETIGNDDETWKTVLVSDGEDWKIGIEVEKQSDGFSVIFYPEPPDAKSGELKLIHESKIKPSEMSVGNVVAIVKRYGKGITPEKS